MKLNALLSVVVIISFATPLAAQRSFVFEEPNPFKHPVKIPSAVLPVMRREIEGQRGGHLNESTNLANWFFGSRIDLGTNRRAFILRSHENFLNGADNDWFWIVLKTSRRYRMVLFAGTISVYARNAKTHGLRDIETNMATAAIAFRNIYKFNGTVYKLTNSFEAMPLEAKLKRVSCGDR